MRKFVSFMILAMAFTTPAFAKVTAFSVRDALNKILESKELSLLEQRFGRMTLLSVDEHQRSNVYPVFRFKIFFSSMTGTGERECAVRAEIAVVQDERAPSGVTAAKMTSPEITLDT